MGRKLHYRPNSYYMQDDRTGFFVRAETTRRQWNGLQVNQRYWEARQPQDLVKGVPDYQGVPIPRVKGPNLFVGPVFLSLTSGAAIGDVVLNVDTLIGAQVGAVVGVMLGSGVNQFSTIVAFPTGAQVQIADPLVGDVPSGNQITVLRQNAAPVV